MSRDPFEIYRKERILEDRFDLLHEDGSLPKKHPPLVFPEIHVTAGPAFIAGEIHRKFLGMDDLLRELGCAVSEARVEVKRASGMQTAQQMYEVVFPEGSRIIKYPKERTPHLTASGQKRRGAKEPRKGWDLHSRQGQVLILGDTEDYIVTYYRRTSLSPEYFDRGVVVVEKE